MIDHARAQELAAAAFDFDLSTADRSELRRHLDGCAACRAISDELSAMAEAIKALPTEDAPADLRQRAVEAASAGADAEPARGPAVPPLRLLPVIPDRYRWPMVLLTTAAVLVALIGGTMTWQSGRDDPGVALVSPSPAGPSGSVQPGSSLTPGSSIAPGPDGYPLASAWKPVADLTAGDPTDMVLGLDSSFRLASLDGTPPADLASRLRVEPSIELVVTPESDGQAVRLTPREPLTPGAVYRFTLAGPNGETLDSWAFQARQPVRVVSTLPEDTMTGVPVDTGIEITFDQDGVTDAASHVTIEPKTKGRFEQHGRVLAFVPDRLKPGTVYTVTVSSGVSAAPTGQAMTDDVRFQFETAKSDTTVSPTIFQFSDDLFDSSTASRPIITMWDFTERDDEGETGPDTARIEVYRLDGLEKAVGAFRQVRAFPRWVRWSAEDLVPTTDLSKVLALDARFERDAPIEDAEGLLWFRLPERLPAGWYLVHHPSTTRPIQAILQVTDIASYLVVSDTKTLVWANDLDNGRPISGATVAALGSDLGRTDADGLLAAATPATLGVPADRTCGVECVQVITITTNDGRSSFLPATGSSDVDGKGGIYAGAGNRHWLSFHTDRTLYRRTDTVNVWGVIRDRDSGAIPDHVSVHLVFVGDDYASAGPPLSTLDLQPRSTGAFTGSVALQDVPEGRYDMQLLVGTDVIGSASFEVDRILKPAYRLEVETGHRAYVVGERIKATVRASFYDGSPVPGVPLRVNHGETDQSAKTDATGTAVVRTIAAIGSSDDDGSDREYQEFYASPRRAEEGQIDGATRPFLVFPSSRTINAESLIRGGRVRVSGAVHTLDRDRLERDLAAGLSPWEVDPRGDPVRGATVVATFVELIPVRTRIGTAYDFIEKKTVPVYSYRNRERVARTMRIKTDARGRFAASIADSAKDHDYRVSLRVSDPDRLVAQRTMYASPAGETQDGEARPPWLGATSEEPRDGYGAGDRIDVTVRDPGRPRADDSRYLFHVAQRGLREFVVQPSSRFVTTFAPDDAPNLSITGVKFTGSGYIVAGDYTAVFRAEDRRIRVGLVADESRYGPRDKVTVGIRTRDPAGKPVAATVILRAIDEKLFTIGGAAAVDPLPELYVWVESGIRSSYASHHPPQPGNGGGDTGGGGGDRDMFRDALLFKAVETGADGRASVSFRLSDDLTSWRVLAAAFSDDLAAGEGSVKVAVGLPFFVDASIAPEYLAADRPTIVVRAFGTALDASSKVTISVTSDSLGVRTGSIRATAFKDVAVRLPKLTLGRHSLTITARTGSGASARTDRLTRTFVVVDSRLTRPKTSYVDLTASARLDGGDGMTTVVVSDASAGRHVPLLVDLASGGGVRLERALAAELAASLLAERFGSPEGTRPPGEFSGGRYQVDDEEAAKNGGLALVPHGGSDLERSALVAIVAPEEFDAAALKQYLTAIRAAPSETRERRMYALAGLAGLGAPVLPDIQAAASDADLTIRERLMIGLGAAAIGDGATARSIAASLISEYGEGLDAQARLRVGETAADISEGTALMAILAAAAGEPLAPAFWAYVEANPSADAVHDLHAIAYIERLLDRLPPHAASFAYVIGDTREVVELPPGETFTLTVTANQLASLKVEPLSGSIGVTTDWREPVNASAFDKDPDISISRSVRPAGTIGSDDLVVVDLRVRFGPQAPSGCHLVTELVPSGLIAVGSLEGWVDPQTGEAPVGASFPYEQVGQRVSFCAEATPEDRVADLRYVARVVTPGTYVWEPAVVESRTGADRAALTGRVTIRIR